MRIAASERCLAIIAWHLHWVASHGRHESVQEEETEGYHAAAPPGEQRGVPVRWCARRCSMMYNGLVPRSLHGAVPAQGNGAGFEERPGKSFKLWASGSGSNEGGKAPLVVPRLTAQVAEQRDLTLGLRVLPHLEQGNDPVPAQPEKHVDGVRALQQRLPERRDRTPRTHQRELAQTLLVSRDVLLPEARADGGRGGSDHRRGGRRRHRRRRRCCSGRERTQVGHGLQCRRPPRGALHWRRADSPRVASLATCSGATRSLGRNRWRANN